MSKSSLGMSRTSRDMRDMELTGALEVLKQVRSFESFSGTIDDFWNTYISGVCRQVQGSQAIASLEIAQEWKPIAVAIKKDGDGLARRLLECLPQTLEAVVIPANSRNEEEVEDLHNEGENRDWIISTVLNKVGGVAKVGETRCMLSVYLEGFSWEEANARQQMLESLDYIPRNFQFKAQAREAIAVQRSLGSVLDMMVLVNEKEKFLTACMTFCNEMASRHNCDRVSVGWEKKKYIRIRAMSHREDFDKKMDATQSLELAMEEAVDQNAEVYWSVDKAKKSERGKANPEKVTVVDRDHEKFSQEQNVQHILSIPLRVSGGALSKGSKDTKRMGEDEREAVGVCTFERNSRPFSPSEIKLLRLYCEQATRRFEDLRQSDRWIGSLIATRMGKRLSSWLGFEHTWIKLAAVVGVFVLAFVCFVPVPYRIEGTTILRTDHMMYLTAPFNGHIDQVHVRVGDEVGYGAPLLHLDQRDLLLEEASLLAETKRYSREMEKARAVGALADMRIADAMLQQATARLEIVRHKIQQAVIPAAFSGVIVEGDQMERVGSPVNQGDVLFKLAQLDSLYVIAEVSERDVHQLADIQKGTLALTSRPKDKFSMKVMGYEPAAVSKPEGNVFLVRCLLDEAPPKWFRPGMTGLAKLEAGRKSLLWIMSHKTMDFLRLKLWW